MKIKWTNTCTKLSIAFFCAIILGYSVCNDSSFREIITENRSENHATDSLLQMNLALLDSLRSDISAMNDSVTNRMAEIDSTFQKCVNTVENSAKKQNSMLYQIRRSLN